MTVISNPLLRIPEAAAGGGGEEASGYKIERSLRFNSADTPRLDRTPTTKGNRRTWTYSCWFRFGKLPSAVTYGQILFAGGESDQNQVRIGYEGANYNTGRLQVQGNNSNSNIFKLETNALFRDPSAWYHICVAFDSTNGISRERVKVFINGERITSFADETYPSQNVETHVTNTMPQTLGCMQLNTTPSYVWELDGYLADVHLIDGLALSPAAFGSFDSTGVWNAAEFSLPNPNKGVTYSTAGTASGNSNSNAGPDKAFDGNITTQTGFAGSSYGAAWNDNRWTLTDAVPVKSQVRIYTNDTGLLWGYDIGNGFEQATTISYTGSSTPYIWTLPYTTEFKGICCSNSQQIFGVEVDGVVLIDDLTDPTTRDNPNSGITWSTYGTFTNYASASNAFDGKVAPWSTTLGDATNSSGSSNSTWTWDLGSDKKITGVETIGLHIWPSSNQSGSNLVKINGTDVSAQCLAYGEKWVDVEIDNFTEFEKLEIANNYWYLAGISINGHLLVDTTVDNSFRLKFDDTASNATLGGDSLSTETIRKPGGFNTDANKDELVLAIPGDTIEDVHHTIKGSGSAKSLDDPNCTSSTTAFRLYSKSTHLNGTNAKLTTTTDSSDFDISGGTFTFECWFMSGESTSTSKTIITTKETGGGTGSLELGINQNKLFCYSGSNQIMTTTQSTATVSALTTDQWYHLAVTRDGTTWRWFIDGVLAHSNATSVSGSSDGCFFGYASTAGGSPSTRYLKANLQDIRFYKGTAKYTSAFAPPTRNNLTVTNLAATGGGVTVGNATGALPIYNTSGTPDYGETKASPASNRTDSIGSNCVLSMPLSDSGNSDSTTWKDISADIAGSGTNKSVSRTGSTIQHSTAQSRLYGGSTVFTSASGNHLQVPYGSDFDFTSDQNHTIEGWLYHTANVSGGSGIWSQGTSSSFQLNINVIQHSGYPGYCLNYECPGGRTRSDDVLPLNKWVHFACVSDGGTKYLFIDGKKQSSTSTNSVGTSDTIYISRMVHDGGSYGWAGYLQDLRVYRAVKYNSDFTVPALPDNTTIDLFVDSPTNYGTDAQAGGEVRGNYCTMNPLSSILTDSSTITDGNLKVTGTNSNSNNAYFFGTMGVKSSDTSGYYYEVTQDVYQAGAGVGFLDGSADIEDINTQYGIGEGTHSSNGDKGITLFNDSNWINYYGTATSNATGDWTSNGDVVGVAVRANKIWISINGTWYNSGNPDPDNEANPTITLSGSNANKILIPMIMAIGNGTRPVLQFNGGQRAFKYAAPNGFKSYCTKNLPDTFSGQEAGIKNNPSKFFDVKTYTGTGADHDIKGVGFNPDFLWIKRRSTTQDNIIFDEVRGFNGDGDANYLFTNSHAAETHLDDHHLKTFNDDGFTLMGDSGKTNISNGTYVSLMWDAGTAGAGNTAGTIDVDSPNQWVNQTAGFSITKYTGNNTASQSIGHGLTDAPAFIIIKKTDAGADWHVGHNSINWEHHLYLGGSGSAGSLSKQDDANCFSDTAPDDTKWYTGANGSVNGNTNVHIAYCWTPIEGYSAFGKYTGNGSSTGPFVYTGFRPKFVLVKNTSNNGNWNLFDSERSTYNPTGHLLLPNSDGQEATESPYNDFLSNGFKLRTNDSNQTGSNANQNNDVYVYAAFAEHPLKLSRAR